MRVALVILLLFMMLILSVAALSAHPPLSSLPETFIRNGSVDWDSDGSPDVVIVIGSNASYTDLYTAVMIAKSIENLEGVNLTKLPTNPYYCPRFGDVFKPVFSRNRVELIQGNHVVGEEYQLGDRVIIPQTEVSEEFIYLVGKRIKPKGDMIVENGRLVFKTDWLELRNGTTYYLPWIRYNISAQRVIIRSSSDYELNLLVRREGWIYAAARITPGTMAWGFQFPISGSIIVVRRPIIKGDGLSGLVAFNIEKEDFNVSVGEIKVRLTSLLIPPEGYNFWKKGSSALFNAELPESGRALMFSSNRNNYTYYLPNSWENVTGYRVEGDYIVLFEGNRSWSRGEVKIFNGKAYALLNVCAKTDHIVNCDHSGRMKVLRVAMPQYMYLGGRDVLRIKSPGTVFSKVVPIYTDRQVFVNGELSPELQGKTLILIGGPRVNELVNYLQAKGYLNTTIERDGLRCEGKSYDLNDVLRLATMWGVSNYTIDRSLILKIGSGVGAVEYANGRPWGSDVVVVAGSDRYGTMAAGLALCKRIFEKTEFIYYAAGRSGFPDVAFVLGLRSPLVPNSTVPYEAITVIPRECQENG